MADKKVEEKKMSDLYEIKTQDQKQKLLNLDNGSEEEIVVTTKSIAWKNGATTADKVKVLEHLITPVETRIELLAEGFKRMSYAESKEKALSAGVYATQGIRSAIQTYLGQFSAYQDMSAKQIWESWLAKYQDKDAATKAKAKKVLDLVRSTQTIEDPLA